MSESKMRDTAKRIILYFRIHFCVKIRINRIPHCKWLCGTMYAKTVFQFCVCINFNKSPRVESATESRRKKKKNPNEQLFSPFRQKEIQLDIDIHTRHKACSLFTVKRIIVFLRYSRIAIITLHSHSPSIWL